MTDTINWRELDLTDADNRSSLNQLIAKRAGWVKKGRMGQGCPRYCTDLNAAIQLQHEGYLLKIGQILKGDDKIWMARYEHPSSAVGGNTWHESLCIAICLAWLKHGERG